MTGVWQDYVRQVLRLDEEEIELWNRIAGAVQTDCGRIIQMMIRREREEMESLRSLLGEQDVCDPGECPRPPKYPHPGYDPGYKPGYGPDYKPGYGPGYKPGYGPGYKHDPVLDPMPYTEKDKEGK
jgi:hypothetical protein